MTATWPTSDVIYADQVEQGRTSRGGLRASGVDWPEPRPLPWQALARVDWHFGFSGLFEGSCDVVVLYHSVGGVPGIDYRWDLPEPTFREQIRTFDRRYEIVDLETLVTEPDADTKRLAITFDDGFRNVCDVALPILREYQAPATLFVCPAFVGADRSEAVRRRHGLPEAAHDIVMTPEQLRTVASDPLFEIGNHTKSHADLAELPDTDAVREEVVGGKRMLEAEFDVTVDLFSYPYGSVDDRAESVVEDTHRIAVTSEPSLACPPVDAHSVPRLDACRPASTACFEATDLAFDLRMAVRRLANRFP